MSEIKISLSLLVPGTGLLTPEFCEKNPKKSYDRHRLVINETIDKGKKKRVKKAVIVFKTRKPKLVTQNINICEEAYNYMIATPTSPKYNKPLKFNTAGDVVERVWDTLSIDTRLREYFDSIAHDFHAVSYSYQILGD